MQKSGKSIIHWLLLSHTSLDEKRTHLTLVVKIGPFVEARLHTRHIALFSVRIDKAQCLFLEGIGIKKDAH
jgi:hypothetical protein